MKINASITANFFLKKARQEKIPVTPMKLQKLVYIAHGWVLAILGNETGVLDNEEIQAWQHGPVIPSLYHEFKHIQNSPINDWSRSLLKITDSQFVTNPVHFEEVEEENKKQLQEILNAVWEAYKNYTAWGLSQKTHEKETPWNEVYVEGKKHIAISNELIRKYYQNYLHKLMENND
ncbi:MAG: DUF4065 domain-containing protein [Chlamydiota bacterium]|jgi:uncharacterized phage-associated protein